MTPARDPWRFFYAFLAIWAMALATILVVRGSALEIRDLHEIADACRLTFTPAGSLNQEQP